MILAILYSLKDKRHIALRKLLELFILSLIFTIIYMFGDDSEFGGINNIQEMIKNELLKDKIKKEIEDVASNKNNNTNTNLITNKNNSFESFIVEINDNSKEIKDIVKKEQNIKEDIERTLETNQPTEKAIEETTKKITKQVREQDLQKEEVTPGFWQRLFNRFYFSVVTGTTLGYGDIYPISNRMKIMSIIQLSLVFIIIISNSGL